MGLVIRLDSLHFVVVVHDAGVVLDGVSFDADIAPDVAVVFGADAADVVVTLGVDIVFFGVDVAPGVAVALGFIGIVFDGVEVAFSFGVTFALGTGCGFLPSNNASASSAEIRS